MTSDPPTRTDRLRTRLSSTRRPLAILLCLVLIASSVPLPVGADFTTEEWRVSFGSDTNDNIREIIYADGTVFVTLGDGDNNVDALYALDAADGSEKWNVSTGTPKIDGLAVLPDENKVYWISGSGNVFVYDMADGTLLHSHTTTIEYRSLEANTKDNRLYATARDNSDSTNYVRELSPTDGTFTGREMQESRPAGFIGIDETNGLVQTLGGGTTITYNAELTTTVDNDDADAYPRPRADSTNSTSYWIEDGNTNVTEFKKSDDSKVDSVEPFSGTTVSAVGVAGDRDTVVVFTGSEGDSSGAEIVRYNTDVLSVDGEEDIRLTVPEYMEHSDIESYEVEADVFNETSGDIETVNATADANVTSLNTSVITVDNSTDELVATHNTAVANVVSIRAEYKGLSTEENVTVAAKTLDNFEILPPWARFDALFQSNTAQGESSSAYMLILIGGLAAGAFGRKVSPYAGFGAFALVIVMGWLIGEAGTGVLLVALSATGFAVLNHAANIDTGI